MQEHQVVVEDRDRCYCRINLGCRPKLLDVESLDEEMEHIFHRRLHRGANSLRTRSPSQRAFRRPCLTGKIVGDVVDVENTGRRDPSTGAEVQKNYHETHFTVK